MITGRNEENLVKTCNQCQLSHSRLIVGDLTNEAHVERILEQTLEEQGRLDVLVSDYGEGMG